MAQIKKNNNESFFPYLDWILKKKGKENKNEEELPYPMIVNRWISMADPCMCQIVNATTNRWIMSHGVARDKLMYGRFLKTIIPKFLKKISYIKKIKSLENNNKKDEIHEVTNEDMAYTLELSVREIEIYKNLLAELKPNIK